MTNQQAEGVQGGAGVFSWQFVSKQVSRAHGMGWRNGVQSGYRQGYWPGYFHGLFIGQQMRCEECRARAAASAADSSDEENDTPEVVARDVATAPEVRVEAERGRRCQLVECLPVLFSRMGITLGGVGAAVLYTAANNESEVLWMLGTYFDGRWVVVFYDCGGIRHTEGSESIY